MICKNLSQNWEYLLFDILLPVEVKYLHLKPRFSVQVNDFYIERKKSIFPSSDFLFVVD